MKSNPAHARGRADGRISFIEPRLFILSPNFFSRTFLRGKFNWETLQMAKEGSCTPGGCEMAKKKKSKLKPAEWVIVIISEAI